MMRFISDLWKNLLRIVGTAAFPLESTHWETSSVNCVNVPVLLVFFSNHSLRPTAATRLFAANVDQQLIKLKTGHTSDAVRSYKRVSDDQLSGMTDIISSKRLTEEIKTDTDIAGPSGNMDVSSGGLFSHCQFTGSVNINVTYN